MADSQSGTGGKAGRFVGYVRLVDACREPGCPACRLVTQDSRRHLNAILYEQVTDPDTRRRLRASWGFCGWHAWMLLEVENSPSGAAIIYEDLVRTVIDRLGRLSARSRRAAFVSLLPWLEQRSVPSRTPNLYRRRELCPVCESTAAAEQGYLQTLARFIGEPDLRLAYASSDGLCAPHAVGAIEIVRDSAELRELLDLTLQKWARVRDDLASFIRKHDYRNTEPYTDADATSYTRAFELLAGATGVFGNDLHATVESIPRRRRRRGARGDAKRRATAAD